MRGVDYFADPLWAGEYDNQVHNFRVGQEARAGRNFIDRPMQQREFEEIYLSVHARFQHAQHENRDETLWTKIPELDTKNLTEKVFDRPRLRPFRLNYDTIDEVKMRFKGTCILIKGNPFYVSDTRVNKRLFYLLLEDIEDKKSTICLDEVSDFRSPPPGYVQMETEHAYMTRVPARVNQQGLNSQNTTLRRVSTGKNISFNSKGLVAALSSKGSITPWKEDFRDLMVNKVIPEFRLSDEVALFTKKGVQSVYAGYRGRVFGTLEEGNTVKAYDEDDLIQPWVKKHFDKVQLNLRG